MNKKNIFLISFVSILLLGSAFAAGFWAHGEIYPTLAHFPVLSQAYQLIQQHGYQELPQVPQMEYGAIRGMIDAYQDPHTSFLEPVQAALNNDSLSGSYGGIGSQMSRDSQGYVVLHPFPDSPAAQAGLLDGDRLLKVDGTEITPGTSMEDVAAMVRGPEGKKTSLTIARPPDYKEMEFAVKRANIPLPSVSYHLDVAEPKMGVIRVNIIASSTPDEIQDAVKDLQSRGASHFTLDLRGNGGGLLIEGIEIARLFLKEGIVIQHQYQGEAVETFEVKRPGPLAEIQLAILVDGNTASAAEIISGALQNHNRAPLIGTPTFGKDSIQLVFKLQDDSSLHVTSAKWWVPGLEPPVGEGGLLPDILVSAKDGGESDLYMNAAIQNFFGD